MNNYANGTFDGFEGEDDYSINAIDLTTVHSAKGLEWPAVFVPSLTSQRFPSSKTGTKQDWLVPREMFDASRYEGSDEDERRLFYVAITRARESVLLIARRGRESEFVAELIDAGVVVSADGQSRLKSEVCPSCGKGLMVERQGKFGPFLACNRFPACATTQAIQP